MARKRLAFRGFLEIPDGVDADLGWTVSFKGKGEITGTGDKLTRKDTGEATVTETLTLTIDSDETTLGKFEEPSGPLDEALAGEPA